LGRAAEPPGGIKVSASGKYTSRVTRARETRLVRHFSNSVFRERFWLYSDIVVLTKRSIISFPDSTPKQFRPPRESIHRNANRNGFLNFLYIKRRGRTLKPRKRFRWGLCCVTTTRGVLLALLRTDQDAFAADYQDEEYRLGGMAIKFVRICGREGPHSWKESGDG
jgi:hypothetical protein